MMSLTEKQKQEVLDAMRWLGFEQNLYLCDFCEDGSVWVGLVQIMPRGYFEYSLNK